MAEDKKIVSIKSQSKVDVCTHLDDGRLSPSLYELGALLRIADALETISLNSSCLTREMDDQYLKIKKLEAKLKVQKKFIDRLKSNNPQQNP